jgi:DNA primase
VKQSSSRRESLEKAAKYYAGAIHEAEDYLAERGISLEVARRVGLGVVLDPATGHEQYENRLSIPYITRTGVVDLRFRSMDSTEPKYLGLQGAETHLYNVRAVGRASNQMFVCEGEIDTITLDYVVGLPAVGVPGVNNWKKHYTKILADFERIFLFADGDQAGSEFSKFLTKELGNVVSIQMPDAEDVNSMYVKHGAEYFHQKVLGAK